MGKRKRGDSRACAPAAGEPLTERHVQAVWFDGELRPAAMSTGDGETVTVVHPGEWNLEAGPDFKGAVLEIGAAHRRLEGDVEIHIAPSGWDAHGHGGDPAYANVVAHVTWLCGPAPATLPAGAVSICIGGCATADPSFSHECIDVSAYPFAKIPAGERACFKTVGSDARVAAEVLAAAGETRLNAKARRIAAILRARGGASAREQVFYEEMMAVFGYKRNSAAFRRIAAEVPRAQLAAEPDNAAAALLAAARFAEFNRSSTRPANSPEARLAAAARAFSSPAPMFLLDAAAFSPRTLRAMLKLLAGQGFMGRGRAAAAIANVVVPFAIAERRIDAVPQWLPPEDLSSPVRLMASRMFGRDHYPPAHYSGNGLLIQGLVQIHRDFCLQIHPECFRCTLSGDYEAVPFERAAPAAT